MTTAEYALNLIQDGWVIGLGTGRAARSFVEALGARVVAGLRVRGVPTSQATAALARRLGIPLTTLDEVEQLHLAVDGADEVDPFLNLIKGGGGALVREKIVAASSKRLVILVGAEKLVQALGETGTLPVEVVPFGVALCRRRLRDLGYLSSVRQREGRPYVTENGNHILDCQVVAIPEPVRVETSIRAIPGVVDTGLFLGMADAVVVQDGASIRVLERGPVP